MKTVFRLSATGDKFFFRNSAPQQGRIIYKPIMSLVISSQLFAKNRIGHILGRFNLLEDIDVDYAV